MSARPWVLGVSASHNGAVCLLHGDEIVAAIQEERLSRHKRHRLEGASRSLALRYCLDHAGIEARELDLVVYSSTEAVTAPWNDIHLSPDLEVALHGIPVEVISHHRAHALSAHALSGFEDAALLVVDGAGSPVADLSPDERARLVVSGDSGDEPGAAREIISVYGASGAHLAPLEKHTCPAGSLLGFWLSTGMPMYASLGAMYSAVAQQIFGDPLEAGKVMGLSAYGTATLDPEAFFTITDGRFTFHDEVPRRFRHDERWPLRPREYQDLAASVQRALEVALDHLAARCRALCESENLAYAGGVALNSIANERLVARSGYRRVFIVPAAEDSGAAVGAAFHGLWRLSGERRARGRLVQDAFGRPYPVSEVDQALSCVPSLSAVPAADPIDAAARLLAEGKSVGWFQGRSELGPRALGQRSILCDPRRPGVKDDLNRRVKFREAFRPFAPAILREAVPEWVDLSPEDLDSPFMLRICRFKPHQAPRVPGVVHVDGSARLQTVTAAANAPFHRLLCAFASYSGVPVLLNTSFNVMGEPIVETPEDALWCLLATGLDFCFLEGRLVGKAPGYRSLLDLYPRRRIASVRLEEAGDGGGRPGFFTFDRPTPWGLVEERLPIELWPLVERADGSRDGHAFLAAWNRPSGEPLAEERLARALSTLRRAGALSFTAGPAAPAA